MSDLEARECERVVTPLAFTIIRAVSRAPFRVNAPDCFQTGMPHAARERVAEFVRECLRGRTDGARIISPLCLHKPSGIRFVATYRAALGTADRSPVCFEILPGLLEDAEPAPAPPIEAPAASKPKGKAVSGKLDDEPIPVKAMAAAYALKREGKPVSLRAVCERAGGIDRANLSKRHPETAALIEALSKADRAPKRGVRDRRTGDVDAWDSDADE